jgi:hypothetical protein
MLQIAQVPLYFLHFQTDKKKNFVFHHIAPCDLQKASVNTFLGHLTISNLLFLKTWLKIRALILFPHLLFLMIFLE